MPGVHHVTIATQSSARDPLLNALLDYSDPARWRYSMVVMDGGGGPMREDMEARGVGMAALNLDAIALKQVPTGAYRLRKVLWRLQPDVVHCLLFYASLSTELARRTMRQPPPSVLVRHHNVRLHQANKRLHIRLDRWMANRANRVVAVSDAVKATLVQREGAAPGKIDVVRNGLDWHHHVSADPSGVSRWQEQFAGKRLLVAAGRFDPQKDYPTLVRGFSEAAVMHPDIHLVIAGTGPLRPKIERLILDLEMADRISLVGWVENPYDLMAAGDLFVQASIDESSSQTVMEAAGLGLPVVTTTVGAIREIVGPDYPSLRAGDSAGLARRISSVLDQLDVARQQAQELAPAVRERFAASTMAEGYVSSYAAAIASRA